MSNEANQTSKLDRYQRNMAVQMEKQGYAAVDQGDFAKAHYHFYFAYCHLVTIYQRVPKDKKNEAFLLSVSAQALYMQGCNQYGEQLSKEAIKAYQDYLRSGPSEADIFEVKNYIALCHRDIADSTLKRNAFNAAIRNYHMALEIYKQLNDPDINPIVECMIQLGFAYSQIGFHDYSIELLNDAIFHIKSTTNSLQTDIALLCQLADCYGMLGFVYTAKGDLIKSQENYTLQDNMLSQFSEEVFAESRIEELQYNKSMVEASESSSVATFEMSTIATSESIKGEGNAQISQCRPGR